MYTVDVRPGELLRLITSRAERVVDDYRNGRSEDLEESLQLLDSLLAIVRAKNKEALALIELSRAKSRTCGQLLQSDSSPRREP